jgi:hypothetical protein
MTQQTLVSSADQKQAQMQQEIAGRQAGRRASYDAQVRHWADDLCDKMVSNGVIRSYQFKCFSWDRGFKSADHAPRNVPRIIVMYSFEYKTQSGLIRVNDAGSVMVELQQNGEWVPTYKNVDGQDVDLR